MKEHVVNVRRSNKMIDKFQEKYEKDFIKEIPTCEIIAEYGKRTNYINEMKGELDKKRFRMEKQLKEALNKIISDLENRVKTPEEIKEFEKLKEILSKLD